MAFCVYAELLGHEVTTNTRSGVVLAVWCEMRPVVCGAVVRVLCWFIAFCSEARSRAIHIAQLWFETCLHCCAYASCLRLCAFSNCYIVDTSARRVSIVGRYCPR